MHSPVVVLQHARQNAAPWAFDCDGVERMASWAKAAVLRLSSATAICPQGAAHEQEARRALICKSSPTPSPLWVKSGSGAMFALSPLHRDQQTSARAVGRSVWCQNQTLCTLPEPDWVETDPQGAIFSRVAQQHASVHVDPSEISIKLQPVLGADKRAPSQLVGQIVAPRAYNVLLVYPRFAADTFWNFAATCELFGARYPAPPLGLITVAALLPSSWAVRLVDRNAEELTEDHLEWADLVMTGGMLPQQRDTLEVIDLCHAREKLVAVGGPAVTSTPQIYATADFRVLGEAEGVINEFITAWEGGAKAGLFEAEKFTVDVTKSPIPRFALLNFDYYLHIGVQFSRGCPFTCEFCDIIELYGRVPRAKTNSQILAELDELYRLGYSR